MMPGRFEMADGAGQVWRWALIPSKAVLRGALVPGDVEAPSVRV